MVGGQLYRKVPRSSDFLTLVLGVDDRMTSRERIASDLDFFVGDSGSSEDPPFSSSPKLMSPKYPMMDFRLGVRTMLGL